MECHGNKIWGLEWFELLVVVRSEVESAEVVDVCLGGAVVEETKMLDHLLGEDVTRDADFDIPFLGGRAGGWAFQSGWRFGGWAINGWGGGG